MGHGLKLALHGASEILGVARKKCHTGSWRTINVTMAPEIVEPLCHILAKTAPPVVMPNHYTAGPNASESIHSVRLNIFISMCAIYEEEVNTAVIRREIEGTAISFDRYYLRL